MRIKTFKTNPVGSESALWCRNFILIVLERGRGVSDWCTLLVVFDNASNIIAYLAFLRSLLNGMCTTSGTVEHYQVKLNLNINPWSASFKLASFMPWTWMILDHVTCWGEVWYYLCKISGLRSNEQFLDNKNEHR